MQLSATFNIGDAVTILKGEVPTCQHGCCQGPEVYSEMKGVPMVVVGNDWPYLACKHIVGNGGAVIDLRRCEVTKCSEEYVTGFRQLFRINAPSGTQASPTCGGDQDAECVGK